MKGQVWVDLLINVIKIKNPARLVSKQSQYALLLLLRLVTQHATVFTFKLKSEAAMQFPWKASLITLMSLSGVLLQGTFFLNNNS